MSTALLSRVARVRHRIAPLSTISDIALSINDSFTTVQVAIERDAMDTLQRIFDREHDPITKSWRLRSSMELALNHNKSGIVQWIHTLHPRLWDTLDEIDRVISSDNVVMAQWLYEHRRPARLDAHCLIQQSRYLSIATLEWIHSVTRDVPEWPRSTLESTLLDGKLAQANWMIEKRLIEPFPEPTYLSFAIVTAYSHGRISKEEMTDILIGNPATSRFPALCAFIANHGIPVPSLQFYVAMLTHDTKTMQSLIDSEVVSLPDLLTVSEQLLQFMEDGPGAVETYACLLELVRSRTPISRALLVTPLLTEALRCGNMAIVEHLGAIDESVVPTSIPLIAECAVLWDRPRVLEWLHDRTSIEDSTWLQNAFLESVRSGRLHLLQYTHTLDPTLGTKVTIDDLTDAVRGGHLAVVQWVYAHFPDLPAWEEGMTFADVASREGHLDVLQWLDTVAPGLPTTDMMDIAAGGNHLEVVQWLHARGTTRCTTAAMDMAASNGYLAVVQWLHENRHEGCTTKAMDEAARWGHLDVVIWLHKHRTEGCTTNAMDGAASNGHLEIVQWLHANRMEGGTIERLREVCGAGEHVETIKWVRTVILNEMNPEVQY